ncbi:MAG: hypothetical protein QME12_07250 [Nanoarchaeota archaeon]|nr:hypothetical protein [Nanoarchaeota archaeon]
MVSITLSIPAEVKQKMEQFPEMNWSGFVRVAILSKVKQLSWKEEMLEKLELEKEFDAKALEIGDKIKEGMWKRYRKKGW